MRLEDWWREGGRAGACEGHQGNLLSRRWLPINCGEGGLLGLFMLQKSESSGRRDTRGNGILYGRRIRGQHAIIDEVDSERQWVVYDNMVFY